MKDGSLRVGYKKGHKGEEEEHLEGKCGMNNKCNGIDIIYAKQFTEI